MTKAAEPGMPYQTLINSILHKYVEGMRGVRACRPASLLIERNKNIGAWVRVSFAGGRWTDRKLRALQRYLEAYTTLMKDKPSSSRPFRKVYFDAFCGSGSRMSGDTPLFDGQELIEFSESSPRVALSVAPRFDSYVFCDSKRTHVTQLQTRLLAEGFDLSSSKFEVGEADRMVADFCLTTNWPDTRCVMFLDPYGLQVGWKTLERIASTRAIDLWYLFPSGLGPLRMTPKSGLVPENWAQRLTDIWGNESWLNAAYSEQSGRDLFGYSEARLVKTGDVGAFERAFIARLATIFPGVSSSALRLKNSTGFEMFSLIFACSNPSPAALRPALSIANHIVQMAD